MIAEITNGWHALVVIVGMATWAFIMWLTMRD